MSPIACAFCGRENEFSAGAFKAVCEGCGRFLHSCLQCRLYSASSGRCTSTTTEEPGDREHCNYCEEFEPAGGPKGGGKPAAGDSEASRRFMKLFGAGGGGTGEG